MAIYVLDTGALLTNWTKKQINGRFVTTHQVIEELHNRPSLSRVEALQSTGRLTVSESPDESIDAVKSAAKESGDGQVLSETDFGLIALAYSLKEDGKDVTVVSTDLAVLNVSTILGLSIFDPKGRMKKQIEWGYKCPACGRSEKRPPLGLECPVCGTIMKRKALHRKRI